MPPYPSIEAIALVSNGFPRRIDRIVHYALHAATAAKARSADIGHVETANAELGP